MFKLQATGYRTRTFRTERAAQTGAARIIAAEYDGATDTSVVCTITRPDGTALVATSDGAFVAYEEA